MNKNYLYIGLATIAILIIGGGLLFLGQGDKDSNTPNDSSSEKVASSEKFPTEKYLEYSEEKFNSTEGKKLLYFYANWCSTCRPVNLEFQEKSNEIPDDLTIFRVNYADSDTDDLEKNLAREKNITFQHTFVLYGEDGNEIKRWNGGGLAELLQILN